MSTISAIVITRNEEKRIKQCLSSLKWANEIIVVDNGSADATREIAKKHGALVVSEMTRNFATLRTIGKDRACSEWLLYIDADEIVTEELANEIQNIIQNSKSKIKNLNNGYEICRKNYYLGHPWPGDEYVLRLMRKDALVEWYGVLHESARVNGVIGRLNEPILHYTHRTLEEMAAKTNEWSEMEAQLRYDAGHPPIVWWRLFRVMMTAFFDSFIKQGGWRAGAVGWIESIYQAYSMFLTYVKLWEKQQSNKLTK